MSKSTLYIMVMLLTLSILLSAVFSGCKATGNELPIEKGPSFSGATGWLNSQPLDLATLRGKVVLVDFWTFTCINWRRTLPYVREWASKYKEHGLVVIGVHTPEFSFEQNPQNISRSLSEMKIDYPVAIDSKYGVWQSFDNQYWPALYLIDAKGKIRYHKFGEGDYAETERQIQQLLKETSVANVPENVLNIQPQGFEAAADWEQLRSPENFLGYERTEGFSSPEQTATNQPAIYSVPNNLRLNQWALSGQWIAQREGVKLSKAPGSVVYRFHARDLHLVMGLEAPGKAVKYRVLVDGHAPGASHGLDIDGDGNGTVREQRMYQLIRQQGPVTDHLIQIEFFEPDVEVYDFTFG